MNALQILRDHNYAYQEPFGELKAGYYWCLCGWQGPDRASYWKHLEALLDQEIKPLGVKGFVGDPRDSR